MDFDNPSFRVLWTFTIQFANKLFLNEMTWTTNFYDDICVGLSLTNASAAESCMFIKISASTNRCEHVVDSFLFDSTRFFPVIFRSQPNLTLCQCKSEQNKLNVESNCTIENDNVNRIHRNMSCAHSFVNGCFTVKAIQFVNISNAIKVLCLSQCHRRHNQNYELS